MRYSYIWSEERDKIIENFVDSEPITQEIKEKFMEFDDLVAEIQNLPDRHVVGPIEISMGKDPICFILRQLCFVTNYKYFIIKLI